VELDSSSAAPVSGAPAPTATPAASAKPEKTGDALTFERSLAAEMARIASHATKIETLKNGATLYTLANGREIEQAPGMRPYVVKPGTAPAAKTAPTTASVRDASPSTID